MDEAVEDGRVYVRLGTVSPPLPWKKCSQSSEAGLLLLVRWDDDGAPLRHPERDLERDEDLLVPVEDRAALESILDTRDIQLPCLDGVPSSSCAAGTLTRGRWSCPKMGILMPLSESGGLNPRGMIDLVAAWGRLDLVSRRMLTLGISGSLGVSDTLGVSGVLDRVEFAGCSCATSSSLSSLPLVPIHTPTPTAFKPLRLPVEILQNLLRCPLKQA